MSDDGLCRWCSAKLDDCLGDPCLDRCAEYSFEYLGCTDECPEDCMADHQGAS